MYSDKPFSRDKHCKKKLLPSLEVSLESSRLGRQNVTSNDRKRTDSSGVSSSNKISTPVRQGRMYRHINSVSKRHIQQQENILRSNALMPLNFSGLPIVESSKTVRLPLEKPVCQDINHPISAREIHGKSLSAVDESVSFTNDKTSPPQRDAAVVPLTASQVLRSAEAELTNYEKSEVLTYQEIYFYGAMKHKQRQPSEYNAGYDDDQGDYQVVIGDHLLYRYECQHLLGKGSFGQVFKCLDHKLSECVAVKIIRNKKRFLQQALLEVKFLATLRDKDSNNDANIIHYKDSFTFRNHLYIVFPLYSLNLYEFIKHNRFQPMSQNLVRRFAIQMLNCLEFLSKQNIIHCDLKPENILLKQMNRSGIKIIDFGSSCYTNEKIYTYIQSRFYRAPEIILGLPYGLPIDIWSFGCILVELSTGHPIFPGENEVEQIQCIMEILGPPPSKMIDESTRRNTFFDGLGHSRMIPNSKGKVRQPGTIDLSSILRHVDTTFVDFIVRCLMWEPEKRLTAKEAMQHDWIVAADFTKAAPISKLSLSSSSRPTENVPSPRIKGIQFVSSAKGEDSSNIKVQSAQHTITSNPINPRRNHRHENKTEANSAAPQQSFGEYMMSKVKLPLLPTLASSVPSNVSKSSRRPKII